MPTQPDTTNAMLHLWHGRALYVGPGLRSERHRHHALQIVLPLEAPDLRVREDGRWVSSPGFVADSDEPHEVDATATRVVSVWSEAFVTAHAWESRHRGDEDVTRFTRLARDDVPARDVDAAIAAELGLARVAKPSDPRVSAAREALRHTPTGPAADLDALAGELALSPRRLRSLFREHEGISMQQFRLWSRLFRAARVAGSGQSLTHAAHEAGFADSAHLSRTFRRAFGFAPREVLDGRNVQVTVHDRS